MEQSKYSGKVIDLIKNDDPYCVIIKFKDGTQLMIDSPDNFGNHDPLELTYFTKRDWELYNIC